MDSEIFTITTPFIFRVTVNCYLVKTAGRFILVDTARAAKRAELEKELENASCRPGNLELIVLTHGGFDHCGNAAYLRETFGARITMRQADSGMVVRGDLFCGDLLANVSKPDIWSIIDNPEEASASVDKLAGLQIERVYPGHGRPFPMQVFLSEARAADSDPAAP